MILGKRMSMNAAMVPAGSRVADIGCDHAKLSVYLVENGIATEAYASDVAEGPLKRAEETVMEAGLKDKIHIRLGYGAETIGRDAEGRPEADVAVMAGIGGMLAVDIVERSLDIFKDLECFIIQAQSNLDTMRARLDEMGFVITDEDMAYEDGKYYTAIKYVAADKCKTAVRGESLDEADLLYGPVLRRKAPMVFRAYLTHEQTVYSDILTGLEGTGNSTRIDEIKNRLGIIAELLDGQRPDKEGTWQNLQLTEK